MQTIDGRTLTLEDVNAVTKALSPHETIGITNLDESIYHKAVGIGSTALAKFFQCPARYHFYQYESGEHESTPQQIFGSALHMHVLEPDIFHDHYSSLEPGIDRRHKDYKRLQKLRPNVHFFSADEYQKLTDMSLAIRQKYSGLIICSEKEVSVFRKDQDDELILKGRLDIWEREARIITDLKTTKSADPDIFMKSAADYSYFLQAALYSWLADARAFMFLIVEKDAPYLCSLVEYDDYARTQADNLLHSLLAEIRDAHETGHYRDYCFSDEVRLIGLPTWTQNKIEDRL